MDFLGFSICEIMLSMSRNSFTFSFSVQMPFISFSCLIALVRTSTTVFNRYDEENIPVLFLILGESIHSFTVKYDVSYGFFIDG